MNSSEEIKNKGQKFWDQNPCGGQWVFFKEKLDWLIKTEPYILNWLRDDLLKDKYVLDVGCGQGLILSLIAKKCKKAIGLDLSRESLEQAQKGLKEIGITNAEFVLGDAENLPFIDNAFDTIYSIGVLHHTPDTQKGINEIHRVLKKNGKAIIMLYRKYTPKWFAVILLRLFSKLLDFILRREDRLLNKLRDSEKYYNSQAGTAALELFGCPVLKAYSSREIKKMFKYFHSVKLFYFQPGFTRILDFIPVLKIPFNKIFKWLDSHTERLFGFYVVIEAEK